MDQFKKLYELCESVSEDLVAERLVVSVGFICFCRIVGSTLTTSVPLGNLDRKKHDGGQGGVNSVNRAKRICGLSGMKCVQRMCWFCGFRPGWEMGK